MSVKLCRFLFRPIACWRDHNLTVFCVPSNRPFTNAQFVICSHSTGLGIISLKKEKKLLVFTIENRLWTFTLQDGTAGRPVFNKKMGLLLLLPTAISYKKCKIAYFRSQPAPHLHYLKLLQSIFSYYFILELN